jgi:predicted kinase
VATLHLMVGLPCSGKTTLAKKLAHERSALRLTPDEWQIGLFGQDAQEPEHAERHSFIETRRLNIASRALELGTNVILDFGFWAREEREDYRLRAERLGASSEVHFLDVAPEELLGRLAVRNSQPSKESFHISEESMKPWIEFFQKPTLEELERANTAKLLAQALQDVPYDTGFSVTISLEPSKSKCRSKKSVEASEASTTDQRSPTVWTYNYRLRSKAGFRAYQLGVPHKPPYNADSLDPDIQPHVIRWMETQAKEVGRAGEDLIVLGTGKSLADSAFFDWVISAGWHLSLLYYSTGTETRWDILDILAEYRPLTLKDGDLPRPLDLLRSHPLISRIRQNAGSPPSDLEVQRTRDALLTVYLCDPANVHQLLARLQKNPEEAQRILPWLLTKLAAIYPTIAEELEKLEAGRQAERDQEHQEPPI